MHTVHQPQASHIRNDGNGIWDGTVCLDSYLVRCPTVDFSVTEYTDLWYEYSKAVDGKKYE